MAEPKKPQDHQPKATPAEEVRPDGWELLKPFDQVPVWEQGDLIELARPFFALAEKGEADVDLEDLDFHALGILAKKLMDYAVDKDAYLQFVSGAGALTRAMNLATAYAFQLGE